MVCIVSHAIAIQVFMEVYNVEKQFMEDKVVQLKNAEYIELIV